VLRILCLLMQPLRKRQCTMNLICCYDDTTVPWGQWYCLLPRKLLLLYFPVSEQSVLLVLPYFPRPPRVSLSSASVLLCCFRQTTRCLPLHLFHFWHFWQRVLVSWIIPCSPRSCRMFPFLTLSLICALQYVVPVLPPMSSISCHTVALVYWPQCEISAVFM
jgi:hypothetical protein